MLNIKRTSGNIIALFTTVRLGLQQYVCYSYINGLNDLQYFAVSRLLMEQHKASPLASGMLHLNFMFKSPCIYYKMINPYLPKKQQPLVISRYKQIDMSS